ncbi:MAG: hypothetical protein OIN89_02595 [Candidatus Methanoperedens sp.]|nr:hypothetical protein [Candidatus Methanoperedens sp.]
MNEDFYPLMSSGKNVLERHFTSLTYPDIKSSFDNGMEDELKKIYQIIESKISDLN